MIELASFAVTDEDEVLRLLLRAGRYGNGRIALVLDVETGEPYARVSINLPDQPIAFGEFVVDHDLDGYLIRRLFDEKAIEDTHRRVQVGYTASAVCRLSDALQERLRSGLRDLGVSADAS